MRQVEDSRRQQILVFIQANPGVHLRKIKRELNLAMGVIQYHLYKLEREGDIVSLRRGLYKRFYPNLGLGVEEQEILSVLSQETERDLLLYLIRKRQTSQKELSEFAHISASSTNWHMKRLVEAGLVEARREAGFVLYRCRGDPARIVRLLKNYHPRIWETWAERLADLLT
jgi:predicted transcriptional regulator